MARVMSPRQQAPLGFLTSQAQKPAWTSALMSSRIVVTHAFSAVVEAIAKWNWIGGRFDSYPHLQVRLVKYSLIGEIHDIALRRATKRIRDRCRHARVIANQALHGQNS